MVVNEPRTQRNSEAPIPCRTLYPIYVALLIPIGPGVIWEIAMISVKVCSSIQLWTVTTWAWIMESIA